MKIALISPLYETVPPQRYGGTERVIAGLADGLVAMGHDVTLFAPGGSLTTARLEVTAPVSLRQTMTRKELEEVAPHLHLNMLRQVYAAADEFDIIHAHTDLLTLPFMDGCTTPTVITLHGRLDIDVTQQILPLYPDAAFVSISNAQRRPLIGQPINWVGTCYNGLDLDAYLATPRGGGDYLAFVGRITREKRPDWAVKIATDANLPLRVAAKVDPLDIDYYNNEIAPLFEAENVEFIGEIAERDKPAFFAGAAATVMPIDWPEPFGLVMVESLAAGTPVIALRNGSVPELLTHGQSGFICDDVTEMTAAVTRLDQIDPDDCRAEARRFTSDIMATRYVAIYRRLLRSVSDAAVRVAV